MAFGIIVGTFCIAARTDSVLLLFHSYHFYKNNPQKKDLMKLLLKLFLKILLQN